jgi:mRNA-degrading endonuclease toxin of MazEF toxin-antitoxin module
VSKERRANWFYSVADWSSVAQSKNVDRYLGGHPRECAINSDHIQTVAKAKIGGLIATLSPVKTRELGDAIQFALDL